MLLNKYATHCDLEEDNTYTLNAHKTSLYNDKDKCDANNGSGTCDIAFEKGTLYGEDYYVISFYSGKNYKTMDECLNAIGTTDSKTCSLKVSAKDNVTEEKVLVSNFDKLASYQNDAISINNEMVLYNTKIPENTKYKEKYRLRIWIDENANFADIKYNNANFSLKINVYSNGKVNSPKPLVELAATELASKMGAGWNLGNSLDAMHKTYPYGLDA